MEFRFKLILLFLILNSMLFGQAGPPDNWFNLSPADDRVPGVATEKAYETLLKDRKSQTVIVAVIDSGVDYEHEDLKDVMWVNSGEIPGNGIDDDKNGYIDDIHGWNFIGGKDGKNVGTDTYELTRLYKNLRDKYQDASVSTLNKKEKKEYDQYLKYKKLIENKKEEAAVQLAQFETITSILYPALDVIEKALDGKTLSAENLNKLELGSDRNLMVGKEILMQLLNMGYYTSIDEIKDELDQLVDHYKKEKEYNDPDFDPRGIVGDNYSNPYEKGYGNNDVRGPDSKHGTHVAGIIAAVRDNDIGIRGVADNVRIMSLRAVPDGDERDKDVANAIIYAVDNGASVINMSFGKGYSPFKEAVDKAVKYAQKNDVLLVHAAGNDSKNNDKNDNFPNDIFLKKGLFKPKKAKNWIEVGASSWKGGEDAVAGFSNFGKAQVDIFAPGEDIYSTIPGQGYKYEGGTSMAAPVVSGVAALIRSYFPTLTAIQVKEAIMNSASKINRKVNKPGSPDSQKVSFGDLSVSGGIINALEAVKLATQTKGKKKISSTTEKMTQP